MTYELHPSGEVWVSSNVNSCTQSVMEYSCADPFSDCYKRPWSVAFGPPSPPLPILAPSIKNESAKKQFLLNVIMGMFQFGGHGPAVEKTAAQLIGNVDVRNRSAALFKFICGSPLFIVGSHPKHLQMTPIQCTQVPTVIPWKAPKYEVLRLPSDLFATRDKVQSLLARVHQPESKTFLALDLKGWAVGGNNKNNPVSFSDGVRVVQIYDPLADTTILIILTPNFAYDHTSRSNERELLHECNLTTLLQHERVIKFVQGSDYEKLQRCYSVTVGGVVNIQSLLAAISTEFDKHLILVPNRNALAVACNLPQSKYSSMCEVPGTLSGAHTNLSWEDMIDLPLDSNTMQEKATYCAYGAEMCYRAALHIISLRPSATALELMLIKYEDLPLV